LKKKTIIDVVVYQLASTLNAGDPNKNLILIFFQNIGGDSPVNIVLDFKKVKWYGLANAETIKVR
jgi:hypothetical protein